MAALIVIPEEELLTETPGILDRTESIGEFRRYRRDVRGCLTERDEGERLLDLRGFSVVSPWP